jgi:hypothetical protein
MVYRFLGQLNLLRCSCLLETGRHGEEAAIRREWEHARVTTTFNVGRVEILIEKFIGWTIGFIIDCGGVNVHGILVRGLLGIRHRLPLRLLIAPRIFDDGGANIGLLSVDVGDDRL